MVLLRRVFLAALFVGALIGGWTFASENSALVGIHFGFGSQVEVQLWAALIGSFGAGVGICFMVVLGRLTRSSLAQRRYRKTVAALEAEVHQLRNLPIEGTPTLSASTPVEAVAAVAGNPASGADDADSGA
jgi:hypothetical protein